MKAKLTLEDGRVIDIELTPEQEKAMEVKKAGAWKPKNSEKYYLDDGKEVISNIWTDDLFDNGLYETGEVYQTEEEAQFARDRKVFITKVNRRIDELNDGWVPDWNNSKEWKCSICFYLTQIIVSKTGETKYAHEFHYIKSEEIAEQIISEFKDDLMKYIFN